MLHLVEQNAVCIRYVMSYMNQQLSDDAVNFAFWYSFSL